MAPQLDITLSGDTNSSVSGVVTDSEVLKKLDAVMRHMQDRAKVDSSKVDPAPATGSTA